MKKIGLYYWGKGGNVESVAKRFANYFAPGQIDIIPLDEMEKFKPGDYDALILGGSTVGASIWQNADDKNYWRIFFNSLTGTNPLHKPYAVYGLGDQVKYPNHFVDGMNIIRQEMDAVGGNRVGNWPVDGYNFSDSESVENGKFIGLAIDEDWQDDMTDARLEKWISQVKAEFGM